MVKNIVILSDGTGQGASMPKAERTNVWKLWDATKKADPARQVTFYDEGLGAEHKREWWRWAYDLASRATGLRVSQNIKDCYTALIEYYEPGAVRFQSWRVYGTQSRWRAVFVGHSATRRGRRQSSRPLK
jgi:uncharacterized protein (DUF2235 family)